METKMPGRSYVSVQSIGDIDIYQVDTDPGGVLQARQGSLAVCNAGDAGTYQNLDGGTTWAKIPVGPGGKYRPFYASIEVPGSWQMIYVRTTGNDNNDGLTPATALLTIEEAVRRYGFSKIDVLRTIDVGAGTFTLPDLREVGQIEIAGSMVATDVRVVSAVVANTLAAGIILTLTGDVPADDAWKYQMFEFGVNSRGVCTGNVGATASFVCDRLSSQPSFTPGVTAITRMELQTEITQIGQVPDLGATNRISKVRLTGASSWAVSAGCYQCFFNSSIQLSNGGSLQLCSVKQGILPITASGGNMSLQPGSYIHCLSAVPAYRMLELRNGAVMDQYGEVAFEGLDVGGITLNNANWDRSRGFFGAIARQCTRFINCVNGFVVGSGSQAWLSKLEGAVSGGYAVRASGGGRADLLAGGTFQTVSADNGVSACSFAADGTHIYGSTTTPCPANGSPQRAAGANNWNFAVTDGTVTADTTAGSRTGTLPAASSVPKGTQFTAVKFVAANSMILARTGADTIDGVAGSYSFGAGARASRTVESNGVSDWYIVAAVG